MSLRRGFRVASIASIAMLIWAGTLIAPPKASCDASGCTFIGYAYATGVGCRGATSSGCYECEYSYGWGTTKCTESASGDVRICYDYQYY